MAGVWRLRSIALLLGGPVVVLLVLRAAPRLDVAWFSAQGHLVAVSAVTACALLAAGAAGFAAVRSGESSMVWLGIGCTGVGIFMLGHGLTTPGVLGQPFNEWVARLPYGAMLALALGLVAAARPSAWIGNRLVRRYPATALLVAGATMAVAVGLVVADPLRFAGDGPTAWEDDVLDVVSVAIGVILLQVVWTHWKRWRLGHDAVQLAVVLAASMSIAAVTAFEHGKFGQLSWWDYHLYLFTGFGGAVFAIFDKRRQERDLTDLLRSAFVEDPFHHIVRGYPEALRSLVRAVEVKDRYTHGHSERTARMAVELGLRMKLSADRLRIIARGAYLHDIGKIGIPDQTLNKPGKLDPAERALIETHPQLGYELASSAPSLQEALPAILHHHERVDGKGYPAGLRGDQIPLEARVVAVADVWDALTTDRSYRKGWKPAVALAHIDAGRETHFDGAVVDTLVDLMAERGVRMQRSDDVGADEAWQAAETCHEVDTAGPARGRRLVGSPR